MRPTWRILLCELGYPTADPTFYFVMPVEAPDDALDTLNWFLDKLQKIASPTVPTPDKDNAAEYNADILRLVHYSIPDLLKSQHGTTVSFGAKLCSVDELGELLSKHPRFGELKQILTYGMDYRYLEELANTQRLEELLVNLQQGNHKPAKDKSNQIAKLLKKDVNHGFAWVIPTHLVPLLPESVVQPLGLATQWILTDETHPKLPNH
jgi:hypothetical protein